MILKNITKNAIKILETKKKNLNKKVKYASEKSLDANDLQELSNKYKAITNYCKGDDRGLLGGNLVVRFGNLNTGIAR